PLLAALDLRRAEQVDGHRMRLPATDQVDHRRKASLAERAGRGELLEFCRQAEWIATQPRVRRPHALPRRRRLVGPGIRLHRRRGSRLRARDDAELDVARTGAAREVDLHMEEAPAAVP